MDKALMSVFLHEMMELYYQKHPERANDVVRHNIATGETKMVRPEDADYPWRSLGEFDLRPNKMKGS